MEQTIRTSTFETNSSSTHSLIIVSEKEFELFKSGQTYFKIYDDAFLTREEISKSEVFLRECPNYVNANEFEKEEILSNFLDEFCDGDYPEFATYHGLDLVVREVYDKDGNKQIAFSYYIAG